MELKICFVVHRYPPFAGGSEYYVQAMAEECVKRGMNVTVATESQTDYLNGVHVTCNPLDLMNKDLIVVHGGERMPQKYVLMNAHRINSPILFLIIEPSQQYGPIMEAVDYIGCSTIEDMDCVFSLGFEKKSHVVRHGISLESSIGIPKRFREKFDIPSDKRMFLSCGGYWPNKQMPELADAFMQAKIPDAILVLTGYDRVDLMPEATPTVFPLLLEDPADVKNAMTDAYCYVMNSSQEGFGLTILEAMINKTPWIGRNIAGARLLSKFGTVYDTKEQLIDVLVNFEPNRLKTYIAYEHVIKNRLIENTVDDIMRVIDENFSNR